MWNDSLIYNKLDPILTEKVTVRKDMFPFITMVCIMMQLHFVVVKTVCILHVCWKEILIWYRVSITSKFTYICILQYMYHIWCTNINKYMLQYTVHRHMYIWVSWQITNKVRAKITTILSNYKTNNTCYILRVPNVPNIIFCSIFVRASSDIFFVISVWIKSRSN